MGTGMASYMLVALMSGSPEYRQAALSVLVADDGDDMTQTQLLGLGTVSCTRGVAYATQQSAAGSSGLP